MWQIEDIIRALDFDPVKIKAYVDAGYQLDEEQQHEVFVWYNMLATMMEEQGIQQHGHIDELNKIIGELQELSDELLKDPAQTLYASVYFQTLPSIVQLRELGGTADLGEIETCFVGIYGYLVLRAKGEEVSDETNAAIKQFSTFLAMLSGFYRDRKYGRDDETSVDGEEEKDV